MISCRYPQAKRDAEVAVSLRPDWAKAHARLGAAYFGMGHLDRAVASYTSCVKLSPDETQYVSALRDAQVNTIPELIMFLFNILSC